MNRNLFDFAPAAWLPTQDKAVLEYNLKFDKAKLTTLLVSQAEIEEAFAAVDPEFLTILEQAAENIRNFHSKQVRNSFVIADKPGIVLGQKVTPIEKVGVYVPGGTAAYPSTVLMDTIPAKIAGCGTIVMVTPPGADGKINPVILAAAKIAGVDMIFKVGGAQAVAALAYGTQTVPKVDKIVGPGNIYVALAKKAVYEVFSSFKNFTVTGAELIDENERICTFSVITSLSGDERIEISLRRDTGSVVLYDGRSAVDSIERVIAAGWGNLYGKI